MEIDSQFINNIADRIRFIRLSASGHAGEIGYTQESMADKIGVSRIKMTKAENAKYWMPGETPPLNEEELRRLSQVCDVTYEWLRFGTENPPYDPSKKNVITIDDNPSMTQDIARQLSPYDHIVVHQFDRALSGLHWINQHSPVNLIFVDYNMPGMDGIDFSKEVRKIAAYNRVPIAIVTNYINDDDFKHAMSKITGEVLVMDKPVYGRLMLDAYKDTLDIYLSNEK